MCIASNDPKASTSSFDLKILTEQIRPSSSDDDDDYFDSVNPKRRKSSVSINFEDSDQ